MEELFITSQERERVEAFVNEQKEAWERKEMQEFHRQRLMGKEYELQPFPGIDEATALQQVRNGWESFLDREFKRKREKEGW